MAVLLLGLAGCDEKLADVVGPTPNLEPTFSSIQREIFQGTDASGRTACVTHHNARVRSGGLDLSPGVAHASLVGRPAVGKAGAILVVPGDPDNSYLVQKLEGAPGIVGLRMPQNGPPFLTDAQILVIRRWIRLGARND